MSKAKAARTRASTLAVLLAQYAPAQTEGEKIRAYVIAALVEMMQKAAIASARRAVHACNFPQTEAERTRGELWKQKTEATINSSLESMFAKRYGIEAPVFRLNIDDPRAPSGYLRIPGLRGDGYAYPNEFTVF